MGLVASLHALSDENIQRIMAEPALLEALFGDPSADDRTPDRDPAPKPGLWVRWFGPRSGVAPAQFAEGPTLALSAPEQRELDLDKAWHGLHYLFTQRADAAPPPLDFLASGGISLGDDYADQGPPRLFGSQQAQAAHAALSALSDDALRARFDPGDMIKQDIYPVIWDRDPNADDTLGYLTDYLPSLRDFLAHVSVHGLGFVVTIG